MALGTMGPWKLPRNQWPKIGNLRYGLFNVAAPQTLVAGDERDDPNGPDHGYGGGLLYDQFDCGLATLYEITCDTPAEKTFDDNTPERLVSPFAVLATLQCGSLGYPVEYLVDKTLHRGRNGEQSAVEEALWTGNGGATPFLATPGVVDVGAGATFPNLTAGIAALEQHAYGTVAPGVGYGYSAVLHAMPAVAAYAAGAHLIETAGVGYNAVWGTSSDEPVLRTQLGSRWVFGGGYPGTPPAGDPALAAGETAIFVSGQVAVWRDDQWTPPDPKRSQFDRSLNQFKLVGERRYLVTFNCFSAYARVAIPEPPA